MTDLRQEYLPKKIGGNQGILESGRGYFTKVGMPMTSLSGAGKEKATLTDGIRVMEVAQITQPGCAECEERTGRSS